MATQNKDCFLNYWDDVIRQWFDEHIEESQQTFLNQGSLNLNSMHMPEPYWGNPRSCSIVIANYNPGGGADRNRHTFRECAWCPESFINQVKKLGYSKVAMAFPIIDDAENKGETTCWWKEYGGRKWWLNKMKWLDEIGKEISNYKESKNKPFAIEFCGWHSTKWPANACRSLYDNKDISHVVDKYFVRPLVDAVKNSEARLGLCIGSQFYYLFEKLCSCDTSVQRINIFPLDKNAPHNIQLFTIHGQNIIVMWGKRRNRYPKGVNSDFRKIIQYLSNK